MRSGYWARSQQQDGLVTSPALNSSNSTLNAPSIGAQDTSSIGRTVSPSVASKKVAPFAFSLQQPFAISTQIVRPSTVLEFCAAML